MNSISKLGSSETTREASLFNFKPFYLSNCSIFPDPILQPTHTFLEWFLGFTEGDGSFQVVKTPTLKNPHNGRPVFTINQKEPQILYTIKKNLGFGTVKKINAVKGVQEHYRYTVCKIEYILQLIYLFQGNLVLSKVGIRFKLWIDSYNTLCDQRDPLSKFPKIPIATGNSTREKVTLNTAWLAGFTDAEGCFFASLSPSLSLLTPGRLRVKFSIKQKGEEATLKTIAALLGPLAASRGKKVYTVNNKVDTYALELTKKSDLLVLVDYFSKYRLLSRKKNLSFVRWKRVLLAASPKNKSEKAKRRYARLVAAVSKVQTFC